MTLYWRLSLLEDVNKLLWVSNYEYIQKFILLDVHFQQVHIQHLLLTTLTLVSQPGKKNNQTKKPKPNKTNLSQH